MSVDLPDIPPETIAKWQRVVDLVAKLAQVPASLIMRTELPNHTVFVSSRTEGNPYAVGHAHDLDESVYCFGVFRNDGELVIEDSATDPDWTHIGEAMNVERAFGAGPCAPTGTIAPVQDHPAKTQS